MPCNVILWASLPPHVAVVSTALTRAACHTSSVVLAGSLSASTKTESPMAIQRPYRITSILADLTAPQTIPKADELRTVMAKAAMLMRSPPRGLSSRSSANRIWEPPRIVCCERTFEFMTVYARRLVVRVVCTAVSTSIPSITTTVSSTRLNPSLPTYVRHGARKELE